MFSRSLFFAISLICLSVFSFVGFAQDEIDALRYSFIVPQTTARSMGFGSALGSVGADFGSLSVNPAGIGVYRSSDVMFTPSLKFNNVDATYLNGLNNDQNTKFNFNNLGIVFTRAERGKRYEKSKWKTLAFGVGLNRLADFNRNYFYTGLMKGQGNNYSSYSELYAVDANAFGGQDNLGFAADIIYLGTNGFYYPVPNWETGIIQSASVEERGGINELVLSLGGNYQEKLMIGATLGLPSVRYNRESYFDEEDATNDTSNSFFYFRHNQSLAITGVGANLKLGIIYKPVDEFRVGVAIHTPTWFGLTETFNQNIVADMELPSHPVQVIPFESQYDYGIRTPWRAIVSATGFLGTYGFITADYEYVDYTAMRLNLDNQAANRERTVNTVIRRSFQGASNFRVGVEGRMDDFFGRVGVGYYGNPYKSKDMKMNRTDFSFGVGYRGAHFFADIAYVHATQNQYEAPYTLPDPVVVPKAKLENKFNTIALTFGWKM